MKYLIALLFTLTYSSAMAEVITRSGMTGDRKNFTVMRGSDAYAVDYKEAANRESKLDLIKKSGLDYFVHGDTVTVYSKEGHGSSGDGQEPDWDALEREKRSNPGYGESYVSPSLKDLEARIEKLEKCFCITLSTATSPDYFMAPSKTSEHPAGSK